MPVKFPYRTLHALEDAQYNFEWLETWLGAGASWTPLAYATGAGTGNWSDYGSGYEPGGYHLDTQGFVHVRATCKNGSGVAYPATNVVIANLPVGARPRYAKLFTASGLDTASHYIDFVMVAQTDGRIMLAGADVGQVPLGNNGAYQWLALSTEFAVF
jgi:hypothetical protein